MSTIDLTTGLSAILFVDAVGYSHHARAHEWAALSYMQTCYELLDEVAGEQGGRLVATTGDGGLLEFPSAVGAVQAGLRFQARLAELHPRFPADQRMAFRIGVHMGDVHHSGGSPVGHVVNIAARLQTIAPEGGICLSGTVYEEVCRRIDVPYEALGPQPLKNIDERVVAYVIRPGWQTRRRRTSRGRSHIRVLNRLSVLDPQGHDVTPRSRRGRAIVGYLALNSHFNELRDRLASILWSGDEKRHAATALRELVRQLKGEFSKSGLEILHLQQDDVRLLEDAVEVDLMECSRRLAEGSIPQDLVDGRVVPQLILDGLEEIDPAFSAWLHVTRRRWRDRLVELLERCLERHEKDWIASRQAAIALLNIDPTHEVACRALMKSYARDGKVAVAIRCYQELRDRLQREFGLEPTNATKQLLQQIRSGEDQPRTRKKPRARPGAAIPNRLPIICLGGFLVRDSSVPDHVAEGFRLDILQCLSRFRDWVVVEEAPPAGAGGPAEQADGAMAPDYRVDGLFVASAAGADVSLALKDIRQNRIVWSDRFGAALSDWAVVRVEIARRIAACLDIYLSAERVAGHHRKSDLSLEAYDLWMQGENLLTRWRPEAELEAEDLFKQVIDRMPHFAPAYASLASIYNVRHLVMVGTQRDAHLAEMALTRAREAVERDPLDTRSQLTLAWSYAMVGRYPQAAFHYDLAVDLNPNNPKTLLSAAHGLAFLGACERARTLTETALGLSPIITPYQWGYLAGIWFLCGDYERCVESADMAAPGIPDVEAWKGAAHGLLGRTEDATAAIARFRDHVARMWAQPASPSDDDILDWLIQAFPIKDQEVREKLVSGLECGGLVRQTRM